MAGDKSEQPTPKRMNEARKKGQVFKSRDFIQSLLFITAAAVLAAGGPTYFTELSDLMKQFFQPDMMRGDMPMNAMLSRMGFAWSKFLVLSAPLLGALVVAAVAANFVQVKALFAAEIIKPKFEKLNPLAGFKNIFFSSRTYIELVKNLIKFGVIFWVLYSSIKGSMRAIIPIASMRLDQTAALAGSLISGLLYKVGVVFLILGGADYMIQKKLHMKNMMMSKEEVKQEYKEQEGDPHVKHMRKHLFEQLMHESVAHNVPKATAVIANPTHLAIALRYDEAAMQAPTVTAKGQDSMALKIIDIAKEHKVPVVRNIGLAHTLFDLEIGHEIPEDMYEAVAEILNFVYQLAATEA
ncbi:MAG TPA: EscU/YscU/HrcU family type III secretion system export apparatus switch protein [Terriglobales bacterium]|jgi:flagellar biosynthesis protein FlhB|nr:EscU/YscU/HrcU family type III secretion system export apparatus switch protein [Terriglobales bacterium]